MASASVSWAAWSRTSLGAAGLALAAPTADATAASPGSDLDSRARIARHELRAIRRTHPDLLVPRLPQGFRLLFVGTSGSGAVDLTWHRASDDAWVHLWQGDIPAVSVDKDPSDPSTGEIVTVDGRRWVRNTINACADTTCLSRRVRNGPVVSLDGTLPAERMQHLASTLEL